MQLKKPELLQTGLYINGCWQQGTAYYPVTNPATGELIAEVAKAGEAETSDAIVGAQSAFKSWRKLTAKERSKAVRRWSELMLENQYDLATILTTEQGKPFAEAMGEVDLCRKLSGVVCRRG